MPRVAKELSARAVNALKCKTDAKGEPVPGLIVTATVGRPTTASEDRALPLRPEGARHVAELDLAPGRWRVAIEAERASDGATYTIVDEIFVREEDGA